MSRRRVIAWSLPLALALSLVSIVPAAVAADNAAVVGMWNVSMEFQGQPVEIQLEIKEADGALAGTWTSPRGTETLSDVKWDGQELSFTRTVNRQGQELQIKSTAKVDGDSLEGKMILPQREIPFSGKRAS